MSELHKSIKGHFEQCVEDLTMPEGWTDLTYGNDACPSWGVNGWQVFIDHPDVSQREVDTGKRFYIIRQAEYGEGDGVWRDTFDEVKSYISEQKPAPSDFYKSDDQYGFEYGDMFITDPFVSECTRFQVDPVVHYNMTPYHVLWWCLNYCATPPEESLHLVARQFMERNSKPEWEKVSLDDWMYEHANDISDEVKAQGTAIIQGFENL